MLTQNPPEDQQAQGGGPEVIGGEIVDPGIDQQNMGGMGTAHWISVHPAMWIFGRDQGLRKILPQAYN
jgi:hypothetical protein